MARSQAKSAKRRVGSKELRQRASSASYFVAGGLNGKAKNRRRSDQRKGTDSIALVDLLAAKKLVNSLGSINKARAAVKAFAEQAPLNQAISCRIVR
jgi:hypothetical protein